MSQDFLLTIFSFPGLRKNNNKKIQLTKKLPDLSSFFVYIMLVKTTLQHPLLLDIRQFERHSGQLPF
jgi:hypothetical protein